MHRPTLAIVAMLLLASCAAHPATRQPALAPVPDGLTSTEVARRFDHALRTSGPIRVTEESFENGSPSLTSDSWMTADAIRSDVYDGGRLVYSVAARGQHVQELIPAGATADGSRGPRFEEYESPAPARIETPRLVSIGWSCHVGNAFGSWVAGNWPIREVMVERLSGADLIGTAEIDAVECAVVRWHDPPAGPGQFSQGATYYVDLDRGWIVRQDAFQQTGSDARISRTVLMRVEAVDPPDGIFELERPG